MPGSGDVAVDFPPKCQWCDCWSANITSVSDLFQAFTNLVLHLPSRRLRNMYASKVLRWQVGEGFHIGRKVQIQGARRLVAGSRVFIQRRTYLDLRGAIIIGDDVAISPDTQILTADHDPDSPTRAYRERGVQIGSRAWIASGAVILPGTVVGEGAVVAAFAVAHGDLARFGIYAGNPARLLRMRSDNAQRRLVGSITRFQ